MLSPMLAGTAKLPPTLVGDGKCPVGKEKFYTQNVNPATGQRLPGKGYYPLQETSPCGQSAMFEWADSGYQGVRFGVDYEHNYKDLPTAVAQRKLQRTVRSSCKLHSNYIPTIFQLYSNYISTILRLLYCILQLYSNYISTILQLYSNYIPAISRLYSDYTPSIFQLYLDYTPTRHIPTISRLYSNYTPTIFQLYLDYTPCASDARSWVPHRRSLLEMLRLLTALEEGSDAHLSGGAESVRHGGSRAGHRVYRAVAAAGSQLCVARGGR